MSDEVDAGHKVEAEAEVVLALGANLGDREATLRLALDELDATDGVALQAVSPLVETDPVGGPDQPDYLNLVAVLTTSLAPADLLAACHRIEQLHGRERDVRWGARTLDLDVIAYGRTGSSSEVVSTGPELTLPHPRAHERAFVLAPWSQVQPDARLRLPTGEVRPVRELLAVAADRDGVRLPGTSAT
ncbi:2-amino-4-hydroxy-6-hydroxymethyldihydropteridine diphosphokinase [Angustibacter sp. McL0619]|uniref:2-amino-4-hydroxy-6- hydroxymethyldihydropteridine diphosphokinase n=1 Tax=Angustibacter sp. McL0619 TaxID=3415676 RepID=UPI003CEB22EE